MEKQEQLAFISLQRTILRLVMRTAMIENVEVTGAPDKSQSRWFFTEVPDFRVLQGKINRFGIT